MNLDPRDVILYVGLVIICLGLWLMFEPEVELTTIGVMLFSVGVWTSMKWGKYVLPRRRRTVTGQLATIRGHHHLLRLHCEPPGTRTQGPRLKRANDPNETEDDGE